MSVRRIFCPELKCADVTLSQEESRHAVTVLRLRAGDAVELFDGRGGVGTGRIKKAASTNAVVQVSQIASEDGYDVPHRLSLFVAMPKGPRQGFLIEKCTELGVAAVHSLRTERGVAVPGAGAIKRLRRRAVEAAKQSGRRWVPTIEEPLTILQTLDATSPIALRLVADVEGPVALAAILQQSPADAQIAVWIGPEGGWSDGERALFSERQVGRVRLANLTLRVETAAVAVCAVVHASAMVRCDE